MAEAIDIHAIAWVDPIFTYSPLPEVDSIRLLFLDNAPSLGDPLRGELIPISLADVKEQELNFSAISYFWGDVQPSNLRPIYIGAKVIGIGPNLHDALSCIRHLNSNPRILWADGVCINQEDPAERSKQVALMRTIFSAARTTICYVGIGGDSFTSRSAWNFLQRESEWLRQAYPEAHKQFEDVIDFRGGLDDIEDDILHRAWFRRCWVLQEVVVSQRLILQSGLRWVFWDDFCKTTLLSPRVHDRYGLSLSKRELYSCIRNQFVCRYMFQESIDNRAVLPAWYKSIKSEVEGEASALDVLAYSRRLQATDQRDKIYALLGINTDLAFSAFQVDYTIDYEDVYLNFTKYYISSMGNYDILSYVDTHSVVRYHSWVPNWMELSTVSRTLLSIIPPDDTERKAQRKVHALGSHSWNDDLPHRLICEGDIIGSISWKSMSIQLNGAMEEIFEQLRDKYADDEPEMNMRILSKWEMFGYGVDDLVQTDRESRASLITSAREYDMRDMPEWALWPHFVAYRRAELVYDEKAARKEAKEARKATKAELKKGTVREQSGEQDTWANASPSSDSDSDTMLAGKPVESSFNASLRKPIDELDIIEQHLLRRSQKTVEFSSDDGSKAVDVIIDRSSIVDQRCFAKFKFEDETDNTVNVALVPQATDVGDLIIAIRGARLPFIVREIVDDQQLFDEEAERLLSNKASRRHFIFIGECLVNNFEAHDCIYHDAEDMLLRTTTFVFH